MNRARVIIYKSTAPCTQCGKTDQLKRTDSPGPVDPIYQLYGPGDDDYGRRPLLPPGPIPPPDPIQTKVTCPICEAEFPNESIAGLKVVNDSAKEAYDEQKERLRKFLDADSVDSE